MTNTSTLSISGLAHACGDPPRLIGMHFFNPVHRMALVEVIVGEATSETRRRRDALGARRDAGQGPDRRHGRARLRDRRLGVLLGIEAIRMVEEGVASAADIDKAMVLGYGHPMGPLELADLVGLDVRLNNAAQHARAIRAGLYEPPAILTRLVDAGDSAASRARASIATTTTASRSVRRRTRRDRPLTRARRSGGADVVALASPHNRNALSIRLLQELLEHVQASAAGDGRALVLDHDGPVFCAGVDLRERHALDGDARTSHSALLTRLLRALWEYPKPLLCRSTGRCAAAAWDWSRAPTSSWRRRARRSPTRRSRWAWHPRSWPR